jgi:hypothetical protein
MKLRKKLEFWKELLFLIAFVAIMVFLALKLSH